MLTPLIIISIILISLILLVLYAVYRNDNGYEIKSRHNKYTKFVNEYSKAIARLKELNKDYQFYTIDIPMYAHDYDNEKFYSEVSCYDYLIYQLQFAKTRQEIMKQIKDTDYNKTLYKKYLGEIEDIQFGRFSIEPKGLKLEKLLEEEKILFNTYRLHPTIDFKINVYLRYKNMGGTLVDYKKYSYSVYDIYHAISLLIDKNGTFYNNRSIWDSICRVERAKVSNRMRFSIYQRDNYRCQMCGRRFETDYLEIDHIYPISKGGKTVYENLQTLCRTCNKNKGNKVI